MNTVSLSLNSWSSVVRFQVFHGLFAPVPEGSNWELSLSRLHHFSWDDPFPFSFLLFLIYWILMGQLSQLLIPNHSGSPYFFNWPESYVDTCLQCSFYFWCSIPRLTSLKRLLLPLCYLGSRSLIWCSLVIYFYISFFVATSDESPAPIRLHHWER